jgi:hypothetical protein
MGKCFLLYLFGLNNRYHAWYKEKKRWGKKKQGLVEIFLVILQWEEA